MPDEHQLPTSTAGEDLLPNSRTRSNTHSPQPASLLLYVKTYVFTNLLGGVLWCIEEFIQLRGIINLAASRIVLVVCWILGTLFALALSTHLQMTGKSRGVATFGASFLLAFSLFSLDRWAPIPNRVNQAVSSESVGPAQKPSSLPIINERNQFKVRHREARNGDGKLRLVFKDSPIFTEKRKEHIAREMESFYSYLSRMGFSPPTEIAPLGTGPVASAAGIGMGPSYWGHLTMADKTVDDPFRIHATYAQFFCLTLLKIGEASDPAWAHRGPASVICMDYYVRSFDNRAPGSINAESNLHAWVEALWEIRKDVGQRFTDVAMCFALKSFDDEAGQSDGRKNLSFNEYFTRRFLIGVSVVDNQFQHLTGINDILRRHKLSH